LIILIYGLHFTMDYTTYEAENEIEKTHWWFVGRRMLFGKLIQSLELSETASILDIGSSTGTNLRLLSELGYTNVKGLDPSPVARDFCAQKGLAEVMPGDVRKIPFPVDSVDLVLATDIIEHVEEDDIAIKEIYRIIKPGGYILCTVPAFQSLWGIQDDVSQHKRRYKKNGLNALVQSAGFEIRKSFYFNFILFIPIWATRVLLKLFRPSIRAETDLNSKFINWILLKIFMIDILTAKNIQPPFGVSILTLGEKIKSNGI
jgi:SAM-dependent methyltransferase